MAEEEVERIVTTGEEEGYDVIQNESQCILIGMAHTLAGINFTNKYKNITPIHGDPSILINSLFSGDEIKEFWDLTPLEQSFLQPQIKLFKVVYPNQNNSEDEISIEFPFSSYVEEDLSNLTSTNISVGGGAGLQSFDWKFQGSDPATAPNIIETTLKLRFNSLKDLAKERMAVKTNSQMQPEDTKISFLDFFKLPTNSKPKSYCNNQMEYDQNKFTFKAIVGWRTPDHVPEDGGLDTERWKKLKKIIKTDRLNLILTMTNHDLDFSEEGVVYLTLHAVSRIDSIKNTKDTDIFSGYRNDFGIDLLQKEIENNVKKTTLEEKCKGGNIDSDYIDNQAERLEELEKKAAVAKQKMWSSFFMKILNKDRVYSIPILSEILGIDEFNGFWSPDGSVDRINPDSQDDLYGGGAVTKSERQVRSERILKFITMAKGNYQDANDYKVVPYRFRNKIGQTFTTNQGTTEESADKIRERINRSTVEGNIRSSGVGAQQGFEVIDVPFFFLGDLIDAAFDILNANTNKYVKKDDKILFGDTFIYNLYDGEKKIINLCDIPISLHIFKEWYVANVYDTQRTSWPINEFLSDLFNGLLTEILKSNKCFAKYILPDYSVKVSNTAFSVQKKDAIKTNEHGRANMYSTKPLRSTDSGVNTNNYITYQIYYSHSYETENLLSNFEDDYNKGIYWFTIGRDRGLIKSVKFSRSDMKYAREARIVADANNQFAKLREHYKVTIKMVGNNLFIPGKMIYVNPSTLIFGNTHSSESIASTIGLVGYYRIISVENFIESGKYETTINAIWEIEGNGKSAVAMSALLADKNLKDCLCAGYNKDDVKKTGPEYNDWSKSTIRHVTPFQESVRMAVHNDNFRTLGESPPGLEVEPEDNTVMGAIREAAQDNSGAEAAIGLGGLGIGRFGGPFRTLVDIPENLEKRGIEASSIPGRVLDSLSDALFGSDED